MRPLHAMNPARIGWIFSRARRFPSAEGCGCSMLAAARVWRPRFWRGAALAYWGSTPPSDVIDVARAHGGAAGPGVSRRPAEDLLAEGKRFQVITALEVIEHVPDPAAFVRVLAALLEPGGLLFLSTLNRTRRSFLVAKLGAEYVLRLLPVGTHDWKPLPHPGRGHRPAARRRRPRHRYRRPLSWA